VSDVEAVAVHLVPLRRRHLRSVIRIEALVYPRPWSLPLFMSEIGLRNSRFYVAARVGGVVAGYAGLMFSGDEAHVTTIAVDPAWHRHQIGTRLMLELIRESRARDLRHLTLEVRVSNVPAQQMYKKFGFAPAGIRRNYYAEINEDALVMWAYDIDTDDYAQRVEAIAQRVSGDTVVETHR
jgi:ribosomal-protein-alanine N-acetyltransferase